MLHNISIALEALKSNSGKYYRYTYNGIGIYEALRKNVSNDIWIQLLKDDDFTWLPKPKLYRDKKAYSYFTKLGNAEFERRVMPIMNKFLDKNKIKKVECEVDIADIVYSDEYQICTLSE